MPRTTAAFPRTWSMGDLVKHLDGISPDRIRLNPAPGLATERDVTAIQDHEDRLYELVDGILVEKPVGFYESRIAMVVAFYLESYFEGNPIGITAGESGPVRTTPGQVRMPDVSVILAERIAPHSLKAHKVLRLAPDLAVEVLSESNTKSEMARKLQEYFDSGVRLVWLVDPQTETAQVFRSAERFDAVAGDQELLGHDVLPGFAVKLSEVFSRAKRGT